MMRTACLIVALLAGPCVDLTLADEVQFVAVAPSPSADLLTLHNAFRAANGKAALVISPQLNAAAQKHAETMARLRYLSHEAGGTTASQRLAAESYRGWYAENVAMAWGGRITASEPAMTVWKNSPPHRANILGSWRIVGFGRAVSSTGAVYWCACFGR